MLNALLLNPFSDHSRKLMVTKQLIKPLDDIKKLIDKETLDTKMRIYSAHDTNVANWM
jgi:hypothetical protein